MNARRFPRTLDQAYGPYHRSSVCPIEPMQPERMHPVDVVVIVASLAAVAALLVIFTYEWIWL